MVKNKIVKAHTKKWGFHAQCPLGKKSTKKEKKKKIEGGGGTPI